MSFACARYGYGRSRPQFRESFGSSTDAAGLLAAGGYASYLLAVLVTGAVVAPGMAAIAAAPNAVGLSIGVCTAATSPGWCWAPFSGAVARRVPRDLHGLEGTAAARRA